MTTSSNEPRRRAEQTEQQSGGASSQPARTDPPRARPQPAPAREGLKRRPPGSSKIGSQPASRGSGDLEGIIAMDATASFGVGSAQISVSVPAADSEGSSNFYAYAASDTTNPASNSTNQFAQDAGRATNLQGSRGYTPNRVFGVKVTFDQDGESHTLWGTVPANLARNGENVSFTLS